MAGIKNYGSFWYYFIYFMFIDAYYVKIAINYIITYNKRVFMFIYRMIMAALLWNSFVLSIESDKQFREDLAVYRKNVDGMFRAVMDDKVSSEILCSDYCNLSRPIYSYCDSKGKFWNKATPLMIATFYNCHGMVEFLIKKEVRLDLEDECGDTALHIAARTGRDHLVKLLLNAGATTLARNTNNQTPLQVAK